MSRLVEFDLSLLVIQEWRIHQLTWVASGDRGGSGGVALTIAQSETRRKSKFSLIKEFNAALCNCASLRIHKSLSTRSSAATGPSLRRLSITQY